MRRCKKQNLEFQKQKIAENISDSNKFWREVKRLKTTSKAIANCIDEANGAEEISNVFYERCRMLYNSVPTDAHELDDLHNTISNDVVPTNNVFITPAIIKQCLTLSDPGYFRQLTIRGGGALKAPPLRSRKLLCQSSPYHTCEFYQVFLA